MRERERVRFYLIYTLLFLGVAAAVYAPFFSVGKSMVWRNDGLYQHYNAFAYLGVYFRKIIRTLLTEHRLVFPMWEFGLGYGEDILTTLSYYAFGDPLNVVSIFTPVKYADVAYSALVPVRVYLAGLAFCAYCRKMDCKRFSSLCGAFMYSFSGFVLYAGVRHPYFVNPMIYMPLIFLGVEKIFRRESSRFYVGMIFISTLSNYYFFYMLALLTVVYALVRYPFQEGRSLKGGILTCLKLGILALLGMGMAACVFVPVVVSFLGNARSNSAHEISAFFNEAYYKKFLGGMISNIEPGAWVHIGLASAVMLGIGVLFLKRKKDTWLKVWFAVLTGLLMSPIVGYLFNGFGYVSHRWCFGYCFACAFIFARTMPDLFTLTRKQKCVLLGEMALFIYLCRYWGENQKENVTWQCILLVIALVWVLLGPWIMKLFRKHSAGLKKRILQAGMFGFIAAGILLNSFDLYDSSKRDYINKFPEMGQSYKIIAETDAAAWDLIEDDSFYRIDNNKPRYYFVASGQSTTSEYWSLVSPYLSEYMQLNSSYATIPYAVVGLRSRAFLLPFASAAYFVDSHTTDKAVPYGYELMGETEDFEGNTVSLYKTENALPLGYTCDQYISREDYEAMTLAQRQQAMLQGAVVETDDVEKVVALKEAEPEFTEIPLEYEIVGTTNVDAEDGKFLVNEANASVELAIRCPADCELYVEFCGLSLEGSGSAEISVSCGEFASSATHYTGKVAYAHDREDYFLHLYYSEEERTSVTITFDKTGIYSFDSLSVIAQPMEGFEERVAAMKEDVLENTVISENRITGDISLAEEKLLCFSVPYSKGWKIFVDGEEAELLQTNIMYLGVLLSAGEHSIELRYTTPFLYPGIAISVICFLVFIVWTVKERKR